MTQRYSLQVGSLVSKSLSIYGKNFLSFLVLAAIVLAPWIAFHLTVHIDPRSPASGLPGMLIQGLLHLLLIGALTYGVVQQLRGQPAGLGQTLQQGLRSFTRVLGTGFLCGLRIFAFTLLLIIPGIIQQVMLFVAIPVAVMEGKSSDAAIQRSIALTDGSRWALFGAWLLSIVVGAGLGGLGGYYFYSVHGGYAVPNPWVEIAIAVFVTPFTATLNAVAYFMLRKGKENIDVNEIAAVFD